MPKPQWAKGARMGCAACSWSGETNPSAARWHEGSSSVDSRSSRRRMRSWRASTSRVGLPRGHDRSGTRPGSWFEWLTRLAGLWPGGAVYALAGDRWDAKMLRDGLQAWRVLARPVSAIELADVLDDMLEGRRWSLADLRGHRNGSVGSAPLDAR